MGPGSYNCQIGLNVGPPFESVEALMGGYVFAEVHLVAAHPAIQHALFPSKIWNGLASKRRMVFSGFEGAMADELVGESQGAFRTVIWNSGVISSNVFFHGCRPTIRQCPQTSSIE